MVVIIPNPNDQLVLVKLQEKLCAEYSSQAQYLCKAFPLWLPLPQTQNITPQNLKAFSKTIKSVTLTGLTENLELKFTVQTSRPEGDVPAREGCVPQEGCVTLLHSKSLKKISPQEFTPMSLKTFRVGIVKQNSTNTVSITDSVWVKL